MPNNYQKQYRENNKEKIAEQHKQYYENNKEKIAEQRKQYNENNKEKIVEYKKQYYEENKEKILLRLNRINNIEKYSDISEAWLTRKICRLKNGEYACTLTTDELLELIPKDLKCPIFKTKLVFFLEDDVTNPILYCFFSKYSSKFLAFFFSVILFL